MIYLWISLLILEAIAFIAKEHADRQKTVGVMKLIKADRFDLVPEKVMTKSWWEQIKAKLKIIGLIALVAILTWIAIVAIQ